ncbi:NnrU family protein [Celeribacter marinus]|uniref:NnrU family protein n=1 Tax=Celeribacter marinus TaxID=1397108 RepID=UPI003171844E
MGLLILGMLLWSGGHLFKRLAPDARANMGAKGRGPIALVLLVSVVLMVVGYRSTETVDLYSTPDYFRHINNLLMVISVALFGLGKSKSRLRAKMRHPMLTGMLVWAVAHLLVNTDVASLVLFGGMLVWSLVEMTLINKQVHDFAPYKGGSKAGDIRLGVITLVVYLVIGGLHAWIGPSPFPM